MKFEESFTIDHPVADAWAFFEDANRLARCVPGVESVDPGEEGRSRLRMTQKVGYMSATFDLRMHVSQSTPNELLEITSRLIVNRAAWKIHRKVIDSLVTRLRAAR